MQATDSRRPVRSAAPFPPAHHGHRSARAWPLRTGLELGPLPGAVPCARAHARQVLWEWGRAELADDAGLVVSELVTNAVAASQGVGPVASVRLWLASDTRLVLVLVGDAIKRPPLHVESAPEADGGRGLRLVAAMSSRWGWYPATGARLVKVVWAEWGPVAPGRGADGG